MRYLLFFFTLVFSCSVFSNTPKVLVKEWGEPDLQRGPNGTYWQSFYLYLGAAAQIDTTNDLSSVDLSEYQSVLIPYRYVNSDRLTDEELSVLDAYTDDEGKVLFASTSNPHNSHRSFNNHYLTSLGGEVRDFVRWDSTISSQTSVHPIFSNRSMSSLRVIHPNYSHVTLHGGEQLFQNGLLAFWKSQHILTVFSDELFTDTFWNDNRFDNNEFGRNLVTWLTSPATTTGSSDFDGDGVLNNLDPDDDGDGTVDTDDAFPFLASEQLDTDSDGAGNNLDWNDDNDVYFIENYSCVPRNFNTRLINQPVLDVDDELPLVSSDWLDFDGDGIGNSLDPDNDNDGVNDSDEWKPCDSARTISADDAPQVLVRHWLSIDDMSASYKEYLEDRAVLTGTMDIDEFSEQQLLDEFDSIMVMLPNRFITDDMSNSELNKLKQFATQGNRVVVYTAYNTDIINLKIALQLLETDVLPDASLSRVHNNTVLGHALTQGLESLSFYSYNFIAALFSGGIYLDEYRHIGLWHDQHILVVGSNSQPFSNVGLIPLDETNAFSVFAKNVIDWLTTPSNTSPDADYDGDGVPNSLDSNDDGDVYPDGYLLNGVDVGGQEILDENDAFPFIASEFSDIDGDGLGDMTDLNIDGDVFPNGSALCLEAIVENGTLPSSAFLSTGQPIPNDIDMFPNDPNEWLDYDGDGIGDNADLDDDNDGTPDIQDEQACNPLITDSPEIVIKDWGINGYYQYDEASNGYLSDYLNENFNVISTTDLSTLTDSQREDADLVFITLPKLSTGEFNFTDTEKAFIQAHIDNGKKVIFFTDWQHLGNAEIVDLINPYIYEELLNTPLPSLIGQRVNTSRAFSEHPLVKNIQAFHTYETQETTSGIGLDQHGGIRLFDEQILVVFSITPATDLGKTDRRVRDGYSAFWQNIQAWTTADDLLIATGDLDNDGLVNSDDLDIDGDGVNNDDDVFDYLASETSDNDNDGIGDNLDPNDDNDRYPNVNTYCIPGGGRYSSYANAEGNPIYDEQDAFPNDYSEWLDRDGDGIGDNVDLDIDGDETNNEYDFDHCNAAESRDIRAMPKVLIRSTIDYRNWSNVGYGQSRASTQLTNTLNNESIVEVAQDLTQATRPLDEYTSLLIEGSRYNRNITQAELAIISEFMEGDGNLLYFENDSSQPLLIASLLGEDILSFETISTDSLVLSQTGIDVFGEFEGLTWGGDFAVFDQSVFAENNVQSIFSAPHTALWNDGSVLVSLSSILVNDQLVGNQRGNEQRRAFFTAMMQWFLRPAICSNEGDADNDGIVNIIDNNDDGDVYPAGHPNAGEPILDENDAFPCLVTEYLDTDNDGIGDNADVCPLQAFETQDTDRDRVCDVADNCVSDFNPLQRNLDNDSLGNVCDADLDGDGFDNAIDAFVMDPDEHLDSDGDRLGDNRENTLGTSNDNRDSDGDGIWDSVEARLGTDPLVANDFPAPEQRAVMIRPRITSKVLMSQNDGERLFALGTENESVSTQDQWFLFAGSNGIESYQSMLNVNVDFTNSKGGKDKLIFEGTYLEYAHQFVIDRDSGVMQTSRTVGDATETVMFIASPSASDVLVFADGWIDSEDIKTALIAGTELTTLIPDPTDTSLAYVSQIGNDNIAKMKIIKLDDDDGEQSVGAGPGISVILSGSRAPDRVYVKRGSQIDATNLKGGRDHIYLAGKWEEYIKTFDDSGNIIFSRDVEINGETVTERITVPNGANVANDDIIGFYNGCVSLQAANTAIHTDARVVSADIEAFDRRTCYTRRLPRQ